MTQHARADVTKSKGPDASGRAEISAETAADFSSKPSAEARDRGYIELLASGGTYAAPRHLNVLRIFSSCSTYRYLSFPGAYSQASIR